MPRLDKVEISSFRGASSPLRLDFAADKKIVVIFGENGTGKTTIVDALDALGNCSGGSIAAKSSTILRDHLPSLGKSAAELKVEGWAGETKWTAKWNRSQIVTDPQPRPTIRVLRRSMLQKFVDSQPAERYREIKHLINVANVEKAEEALKRSMETARQELQRAVEKQSDADDQLTQLWNVDGRPDNSARAWAEHTAAIETTDLSSLVDQLRGYLGVVEVAESDAAEFKTQTETLLICETALNAIQAEIAAHSGLGAEASINLADLLTSVEGYLTIDPDLSQCPVCGQAVDPAELRNSVSDRLRDLEEFRSMSTRLSRAESNLNVAISGTSTKSVVLLRSATAALEQSIPLHNKALIPALPLDGYFALSDSSVDEIAHVDMALAVVTQTSGLKTGLIEQIDAANQTIGKLASVKQQLGRLVEAETVTAQLTKIPKALEDTLALMRSTRIGFTEAILDEVAAECNRIYAEIHPNERLAITKVKLDPNQRASLLQSAEFEGHENVPPQAYFSEAHLDTLGFSFWLAFTKREHPEGDAIVVIDDVFTSVDSPHMKRIADVVVQESEHFCQTIITTHSRSWREIYRNPNGPGRKTQLLELQQWRIDRGVSCYKTPLAIEDLEQALAAAPFDRQSTAQKAGILLENVLDSLVLQYRRPVPRTVDNAYTLGELLDSASSLVGRLELRRVNRDDTGNPTNPAEFNAIQSIGHFTRIRECAFLRNQVGAHYNLTGMNHSDGDIMEFAQLALHFVTAVTCEDCGQIPSRGAGTHFRCSCRQDRATQLLPLQY